MVALRLSAAGLLILSQAAGAQAPSAAWSAAFDRADRESRSLISTIRCARQAGRARQLGLFGPADSLGDDAQCLEVAGRYFGVLLTVDSPFVRPTRFASVNLAAQARNTAPIDTAGVLAVVRAERAADTRGSPPFDSANRAYVPLSFRFSGDTIEVWLIPIAVITGTQLHVGGERGFVFSPDGRRMVRAIDAFGDYRPVAIPDSGVVHLASRGDSLPMLSELVLANLLNDAGRIVSIDLPHRSSVLTGQGGARSMWMHVPRKPR